MTLSKCKVKICGITNFEDARAAVDLGADAIGFVFVRSPRQIKPADAAIIIAKVPVFVNCVGVFADQSLKVVEKIARQCKIDTLQFHGKESPEYCAYFKNKYKVIKAFRVKEDKDLKDLIRYKVDAYLLDTYVRGVKGGTGRTFNWELAKKAGWRVSPVIVSGGLNPENVKKAIKIARPYAVDVSGGIESAPGKKDIRLMKEFIKAAER
jgi:phosphoribosylanthranilate isomerase